MQLRIPGPTPCPPEVLEAMGHQMVDHRGPEFAALLRRVTDRLKYWFQTDGELLTFPASGSGGLEAAVVNTLSPGEKVLAVSIGSFGDRIGTIAATYGADVTWLKYEWGQAADPAEVGRTLDANPGITTVLVTHNETSTAVTNPIREIAAEVKGRGKVIVVDAVSSMGSIEFPVDEWRCDVVVSGSQKGWMVPPGLAMVAVRKEAWPVIEAAKMPRFYWDLRWVKQMLAQGQTPYTPPISLFYALDAGLNLLDKEGRENVLARHARVATRCREGVKRLGLKLAADERFASNTVTAIWGPEGVEIKKLRQILNDEYGVVLAGGQGKLTGKAFRIGHLGLVFDQDIDEVLAALAAVLPRVGYPIPAGRAS